MNLRLALALFMTSLFMPTDQAWAAVPQLERQALLALYAATAGEHWQNNTGWNGAAGTECTWYGVSCDSEQTMVTGLDLKANNLKGALPAELKNLTHLNSSDFRYNGVYSENQSLIDLLGASGPVGGLLDTQTLDADGIVFSSVTDNGFVISWNPVSYAQEGGYRVYLAEQIDSETGSVVTDFEPVIDVVGKTNSSATLTDLLPCRQYFVKVVSYTDAHADNPNKVESDGVRGPIAGTIPGYDSSCELIGGPFNDSFILSSGGDTVDSTSVTIEVADSGGRVYNIVSPGDTVSTGVINGGSGDDNMSVSGTAIVVLGSINISGELIFVSGGIETISATPGTNNTIIGSDSSNTWTLTGNGSGTIESASTNGTVAFANFQTLSGGAGPDTFIMYAGNESSVTINGGIGDSVIHLELSDIAQVEPVIAQPELVIFYAPDGYTVAEDAAIGSVVAAPEENDLMSDSAYSITAGNDDGLFSINSDTGEISLARVLDYETAASHELEVTVRLGELDVPVTVLVKVIDIPESGGCTLRTGTPFDPLWPLLLAMAGLYRLRRSATLN